MKKKRGVVVAGGGTGGHVVPSLQIARALVARGHDPRSIEFFGSRRGQESTTWPALEFPYTLLPGRGIRRSARPGAVWANMGAVLGLLWATTASVASFVLRRPRVVVVVGGYASLPAGLAAVLTRAPVVLMNTDAVPGAVNAMLGRFAAASAVAFPGTDLPRAHLTGTPVRPELGSLDRTREGRQAARRRLGLPLDRQTLTVFGGSLGARRINVAAADLARRWSDRGELTLYQVTGRRDYAQFAPSEPGAEPGPGAERSPGEVLRTDTAHLELRYEVVPYEEHMAEFYGAADVCVCRSGALTVAELLVCGVPAILVPLPGAPRDHQTRNAQALVAAGAAVMVPDEECDADRLASELTALLSDTDRLRAMSAAARALGHADAAARVAELVDAHAR